MRGHIRRTIAICLCGTLCLLHLGTGRVRATPRSPAATERFDLGWQGTAQQFAKLRSEIVPDAHTRITQWQRPLAQGGQARYRRVERELWRMQCADGTMYQQMVLLQQRWSDAKAQRGLTGSLQDENGVYLSARILCDVLTLPSGARLYRPTQTSIQVEADELGLELQTAAMTLRIAYAEGYDEEGRFMERIRPARQAQHVIQMPQSRQAYDRQAAYTNFYGGCVHGKIVLHAQATYLCGGRTHAIADVLEIPFA